MASNESVSQWLISLRARDDVAAQQLYERYIAQLMSFARRKFGGVARRAVDEEDIAQMVMKSFFAGMEDGRFPRLNDRHDLWQVLVMLTERKVIDQLRRQSSKKRRGEVGESAVAFHDAAGDEFRGVQEVMGSEPTPQFAAEISEQIECRLQLLPNDELRRIAIWKLEALTNAEIAKKLGCASRTVERKLELIRDLWQRD